MAAKRQIAAQLYFDQSNPSKIIVILTIGYIGLGGYTAAVIVFFVVQDVLSGYYNWFLPTFIALGYILYWMFKLKAAVW
jgi:hypothetical protein